MVSCFNRAQYWCRFVLADSAIRKAGELRRGGVMSGRKRPATIFRAIALTFSVFGFSVTAVQAAELLPPSPAAPIDDDAGAALHWFVRLGVLGAINQTSSNLYAQPLSGTIVAGIGFVPVAGVGPQALLSNRGAIYSDLLSASLQVGYLITPNWSIEISGGLPVWDTVKITGFSAAVPVAGTILSRVLPGSAPITGAFHFTQFGTFQPYLGLGIAPTFAFAVRDGFNTGGSFSPSLGLVAQGGFDYMLSRNWGVFLDVKKIFVRLDGRAAGVNLGPSVGTIPDAASIRTYAQPWLLATGVSYRF
jgi:outer membrane protein